MKRKCEVCPAEVMAVCRYAFGKYWNDKSKNGEGCDHPLDGVAEAWKKAGWTPKDGETVGLVLPTRPTAQVAQLPVRPTVHNAQLPRRTTGQNGQLKDPSPAHYAHVAKANSRVPMAQVKIPTRPKVSAKIAKQAEMFFGRLK